MTSHGALSERHPSGVRRLRNGRCTKRGAADPDRTVPLVNKRNLLVGPKARKAVLDDFAGTACQTTSQWLLYERVCR
ncbi:MAG: hypothetical protein LBK25_03250 [Treponema sp.]|jgi:hypothetical protein|nr:hypothetical protein [Treponema sp.]